MYMYLSIHMDYYPCDFDIQMMRHMWNFRFHPLEHGLHAYMDYVGTNSIFGFRGAFSVLNRKITKSIWTPTGRVEWSWPYYTLYPRNENKNRQAARPSHEAQNIRSARKLFYMLRFTWLKNLFETADASLKSYQKSSYKSISQNIST